MTVQQLPGIQWQRERANCLVLFLPHTVMKIEGSDLTIAVEALLNCLPSWGHSKNQLLEAASSTGNVKRVICEFAFDLLLRARVLLDRECSEPLSELEALYHFREGTLDGLTKLKQASVLAYCFPEDLEPLNGAFMAAGLNVSMQPLNDGTVSPAISLERWDIVACVGPAFHHPFSRSLNRSAVAGNTPVLFSEYGGWTARTGPTVLGRNIACLDCASARNAANGSGGIMDGIDSLYGVAVAALPRTIADPNLRQILLHQTVLEVSRILRRDCPASFGGYLEFSQSGESTRREVLKVPRCVSCSQSVPERYPYDVTPLS